MPFWFSFVLIFWSFVRVLYCFVPFSNGFVQLDILWELEGCPITPLPWYYLFFSDKLFNYSPVPDFPAFVCIEAIPHIWCCWYDTFSPHIHRFKLSKVLQFQMLLHILSVVLIQNLQSFQYWMSHSFLVERIPFLSNSTMID